MNTRLMRFNSHNFFYRASTGEVFRIIRHGLGEYPYNNFVVFDGVGEKSPDYRTSLKSAMELCEYIASFNGGGKNV